MAEENKPGGEVIIFQTEDAQTRLQVRLDGQTAWLTQAQMAELFQSSVPNINLHLRNIYDEGELQEGATIKEYLIVRLEGSRNVSRPVLHYNLDAITPTSGGTSAMGISSGASLFSSPTGK